MDIEAQLQILYSVRSGQPPDTVMQQFNIDPATYYQLEADKRRIERYVHKLADGGVSNPTKRLKVSSSADDKLELATYKWFLQMKAKGVSVQDVDIEKATLAISNHLMREEGAAASDDWLSRLYIGPAPELGQDPHVGYAEQHRKTYGRQDNSEAYAEAYTNQSHVYPERSDAYQQRKSFGDHRSGFEQSTQSYTSELQEGYPDPDQSETYPDQSEGFPDPNFSMADSDCLPSKIKTIMHEQKLAEYQMYHADETGLHWKAMPHNALEVKDLPANDISRQKMTALLCANADGSHKLKSLMVGNLKHRRALRNSCDSLPVCYKSSTSAFMTCTVFAEWFHNSFVPGVKNFQENVLHINPKDVKAILLLDNAPCHPEAGYLRSHDGNVRVFVMPGTTSPRYRPMEQGIIASCKRLYRKYQLDDCLVFSKPSASSHYGIDASANVRNYTIKDAMHNWALAWKEVSSFALQSAWAQLLQKPEPQMALDDLNPGVYLRLLHAASDTDVSLQDVEDWLKVDEMELGYDEKTVMGIAPVVSWDAGPDDVSEEDSLPSQEPVLGLPEAKTVMDQVMRVIENPQFPKMQRYYGLAKEMRSTLTNTLLNRAGPSSTLDVDTTLLRDLVPSSASCKPRNPLTPAKGEAEVVEVTSSVRQPHGGGAHGGIKEELPDHTDAEARLTAVLARIETKIDVLNFKVDNLERRLDALSSHVAMPVDDDSYTWEELPVRTQEEFELLEAKLKQDNYYKLALERRLMLIGGDSLRSCVKRILEVVLSHEVQLLFNWAGTVGRKSREHRPKLAFKNTEICPILTRVVIRTNEGTTEDLIHKEVMLYLRGCADRCGGRQRRLQLKMREEQGGNNENSQSSSTTEESGTQAGPSGSQRGPQEASGPEQAQFRPSGDPHSGPMPQHPFFGSEGFGNHHLLNLSSGPLPSAMQMEHSQ